MISPFSRTSLTSASEITRLDIRRSAWTRKTRRPDAITYGVLKLLALLDPKVEKLISEFEKNIPGIENLVEAGEKVGS